MNENLQKAITEWQEENAEKRAIIVIAIENIAEDEEEGKTTSSINSAILGKHSNLVNAFKGVMSDNKRNPIRDIIKEAQVRLKIDKLFE